MPAYVRHALFKEDPVDEAYVVFQPRSESQYYYKPQEQTRSSLLSEERRNASELVDLCIGDIPGGAVFSMKPNSREYYHETWDEAEQHARVKGALRISPGSPVSSSNPDEKVDEIAGQPEVQRVLRDGMPSEDGSPGATHQEVEQLNPPAFSFTDAKALKIHRNEEAKLFEYLNILVHPSEEPKSSSETWFLLEADWFRAWSGFLKGGPRPGKINNSRLINGEDELPWPAQEPGRHYVALDTQAWALLSELYGADITIERKHFEIYDDHI